MDCIPIGKSLAFLLGKVSSSYKEVSCLPIRKGGGFLIGKLSCSQSLYASRHGKRPGKKMLPSLLVCDVCAMFLRYKVGAYFNGIFFTRRS